MHIPRARQPLGDVGGGGVGERGGATLRHPGREAPAQPIQLDGRVAALRLPHYPPLIPSFIILLPFHVHVRRLRPLRRLRIPAYLYFENVEGGTEAGEEEKVQ